jgi:hypothetical protein
MKKRGTDYSPAPSLSAALLSLADRLEQTGKAPLEKPCEIDAVSSREAPQVEELQGDPGDGNVQSYHHYGYMNALKFHYGSTYASSYGFYPRYGFYARSDFDRRNTFN